MGGSNNTLTVKGTCGTVSIGGADNKITIDKIDRQLNIVGFNNTISYKAGDPKVDNLGSEEHHPTRPKQPLRPSLTPGIRYARQ